MGEKEIAVIVAALALHRAWRDRIPLDEWTILFEHFKLACEQLDQSGGSDEQRKQSRFN